MSGKKERTGNTGQVLNEPLIARLKFNAKDLASREKGLLELFTVPNQFRNLSTKIGNWSNRFSIISIYSILH